MTTRESKRKSLEAEVSIGRKKNKSAVVGLNAVKAKDSEYKEKEGSNVESMGKQKKNIDDDDEVMKVCEGLDEEAIFFQSIPVIENFIATHFCKEIW